MAYPTDLQYTKDHEWIRVAGGTATVGITDHAQKQLGDVVYVELPKVSDKFDTGEPFGSIESVKAVSEVYMPVSGEVTSVNETLTDSPELINDDPYGEGWMIVMKMTSTPADLLDAAAYERYIAEEASE
jgi:glycine cleavage system H protein